MPINFCDLLTPELWLVNTLYCGAGAGAGAGAGDSAGDGAFPFPSRLFKAAVLLFSFGITPSSEPLFCVSLAFLPRRTFSLSVFDEELDLSLS